MSVVSKAEKVMAEEAKEEGHGYAEWKKQITGDKKLPDFSYSEIDSLIATEPLNWAQKLKKEHLKAVARKAKNKGIAPETSITLRTVSHEEVQEPILSEESQGDSADCHPHESKSEGDKPKEKEVEVVAMFDHKTREWVPTTEADKERLAPLTKIIDPKITVSEAYERHFNAKRAGHVEATLTRAHVEEAAKQPTPQGSLNYSNVVDQKEQLKLVLAIKKQDTFAFIIAQISGFFAGFGVIEVFKMLWRLLYSAAPLALSQA